MKRKHRTKPKHSLARLVDFLNWNAEKEPSLWSALDPARDRRAKEVQDEVREDIRKLLDPPPIPPNPRAHADAKIPAEFWLRTIVDKIDKLHIVPVWHVARRSSPLLRRFPNVVLAKRERFVVINPPIPDSVRENIYWELGSALKSGEFSMLRRCLWCSRYFTTTRGNKTCCNRNCTTQYQNRRRLENGYFKKQRKPKEVKSRSKDDTQVKAKWEALYDDVVNENLQKKDKVQYNKILRDLGKGKEEQGYKKTSNWYRDKQSFCSIHPDDQRVFIKHCDQFGS